MWQDAMNFIRPVAFFGFNYQFANPTFFVLSRTENYFDWSAFSSIGLQFSIFRIHAKIYARIRSEIGMEFGMILDSVGQSELDT